MTARQPIARRHPAPRGEGDRLRNEVLGAAEALLIETGNDEAVSMRAIAARVGCTPAAIYLHFSDKTELIFEVCRRHFTELERAIRRASEAAAEPREELEAIGRAYIRFGIDHPEEYRILFMGRAAAMPDGLTAEELLDIGGFPRVVAAVGRAMDAGVLRGGDPFAVATQLWTVVHGITSALISKPWFPWGDRDALIGAILDTQLKGLSAGERPELS